MNEYWREIFGWSWSRQRTWDVCKLRYYYSYIGKWEGFKGDLNRERLQWLSKKTDWVMLEGELIHEAIESQVNQWAIGRPVSKTAATFFYDLTNTVEPPSVRAVMALAPASNVLFGTDYPYGDGRNQNGEFVREMIAALPHVGLTPSQIAGVARTNAEALFPRLKERK